MLGWVLAAPFLAYPYFVWAIWISSLVPNSTTKHDTLLELIQASAALAAFSSLLLLVSGPVICLVVYFLQRWAKQHLGKLGQWVLCALVVGWVQCVGYIMLIETNTVELNLFN